DLGEQPHALDVITVLLQELPDHLLRGEGFTLGEEARSRDDGRGESRHVPGELLRGLRLGSAAGSPAKLCQRIPARGQGSIQGDGSLIGRDGGTGFADRAQAVATLLKQAAV